MHWGCHHWAARIAIVTISTEKESKKNGRGNVGKMKNKRGRIIQKKTEMMIMMMQIKNK